MQILKRDVQRRKRDFIKHRWPWLHVLWNDRVAWPLLLALVLIAILGIIRPAYVSPRIPDSFWVQKIEWRHLTDVVVAGDSRVNYGVSPEAMSEVWPDRRIVNFGFSGVGYTSRFLHAIHNVLDPKSPTPTIVLGITPQSLTPKSQRRNGFIKYSGYNSTDRKLAVWLSGLYDWLRPGSLGEMAQLLSGTYLARRVQWHPSGWVAHEQEVDRPNAWARAHPRNFYKNQVEPRVIDRVLSTVEQWTQSGIKVYGYRPSTADATIQLETATSGFDQLAFTQMFEQAGGIWLEFDALGWPSFDGSHLAKDAAIDFSKTLASALAELH